MSGNIHADLITNATDMQSQLLQFSHQLSNLSLKSLDDQNSFKMTVAPTFSPSSLAGETCPSGANAKIKAGTYIKVTTGGSTSYHRLTQEVTISTNSYDLSSKLDPDTNRSGIASVNHGDIKIHASQTPVTTVAITLNGTEILVGITASGVPTTVGSTSPQKTVAKAMAVVAMNLRGVGVPAADILEIFKNGSTPTSLAAVESQLKGHHDAVLQLSLESLSRVTNILQKIAQKLGS